MDDGPPLLWPWYGVGLLILAAATARWGRRAAILGWLGGLALPVGTWVVFSVAAGFETGFGSPQATYTAGFGFAVLVMLLGGIWVVVGAVAVALGLIARAWLDRRKTLSRLR